MNEKKYKKFFWLFFALSVLGAILLLMSYIPRSWGIHGVRDFFDMVQILSGSVDNPNAVGWIGLELYFIVSIIATIHFYAKKKGKVSFYNLSLPKWKVILHWGSTVVLSGGFVILSNYLKEITYFL